MDKTLIALLVCGTVLVGLLGQVFVSWLEHRRRIRAMDLLKTELEAGREPPVALYEQVGGQSEPAHRGPPVVELVVFGAMAAGFWAGYLNSLQTQTGGSSAYLVVAVAMSAGAIGCLAAFAIRSRNPGDEGR